MAYQIELYRNTLSAFNLTHLKTDECSTTLQLWSGLDCTAAFAKVDDVLRHAY